MPEAANAHVLPLSDARLPIAGRKVHFIGIGGCGMSGAAGVLITQGAVVSGSDCSESQALQQLSALGARVYVGHSHDQLPADASLVVISAAVPDDNPELLAARARGVRVLRYAELLGEIMRLLPGAAVAGTHGKSTATALTAFICRQTGLDPSFVVGAEVRQLGGGSGVGRGNLFIVEACEYACSFLHLVPTFGVILNIEEDHLDYFRDVDEIIAAFESFAALHPPHGTLLVNHDDPRSRRAARRAGCQVETFGTTPGACWQARGVRLEEGLPRFELYHQHGRLGQVRLAIPGRHNVYNALAATALAVHCGADPQLAIAAAGQFHGADRRASYRGTLRGIHILDDYAHHPTEIKATLRGLRERYRPRRLWVVFQPHQHSRTRFFLEDFARSFELADEVIVPDIYFVRDSESERQLISSRTLVELIASRGGRARYMPNLHDIAGCLAGEAAAGDLVLTMGAGDVWKVADEMVHRLRASG